MKTEKQKAAEGLLYDANNAPDLQREMLETHSRLHRYNLLPPEELQQRDELIRSILHMGKKGCIISPFYCDYGSNIHIGDNFFANTNLVILDGAKVTIGDNGVHRPSCRHLHCRTPAGQGAAECRSGICLPDYHRQ